jgi:exonuclease III
VLPIDEGTTTRFYYQNVNGLKLRDDGSDIKLSSHHLWERQAAVIGLSETNIEWKQSWATNLVFQIFRRQWNHLKWCRSTSAEKFEGPYKPGGTCTLVTGSLATRVISEGSDDLGRWSHVTISGRSRTVTIITAYCPPVQSIETAGPLTSYFQQYHQLRQSGVISPDPRKQFFSDLTATAHTYIQKRHELVIMLDSNDDLTDFSPTHSLTTECGLFSVHEQADYAADSPAPATYARGSKKIDHILVTAALLPAVTASGIEPLHAGILSDHRALFVDFETTVLLNGNLTTIPPSATRLLKSTDPKSVDAYIHILTEQLEHHTHTKRLARLMHQGTMSNFTIAMHRTSEGLDVTLTKGMLYAEKQTDPRHHHQAWSPQLIERGLELKYWKSTLSGRLRKCNMSAILLPIFQRIPKLVPIDTTTFPISVLHERIRAAHAANKKAKETTIALREQFLTDQARALAALGQQDEASARLSLLNHERMKLAHQHLRHLLNPQQQSQGLSRIMVPTLPTPPIPNTPPPPPTPSTPPTQPTPPTAPPATEPVTYRTVHDSAEIEQIILERNAAHYSQAKETPFGQEPNRTLLGPDGTSDFSEAVLNGTYRSLLNPDTVSPETFLMLDQLQRTDVPPISPDITFADFTEGIRKWPERTSTSPSGRHLGHYKSPLLRAATDPRANDIMHVHHTMLRLAVLRACPFERWCADLEVMLEKDPGKPYLHRLRIICLYEADYNLYLKLMWAKRLVHHAEDHDKLGEEQGGSRPGRTAIDIANRKALTYLYTRLTKTSLGTFDNDAKSCYDRIIASLALIASRALGMPEVACRIHGQTIDKMKHFIKTAQGTSESYYSNENEGPLFGSGQGSGGSPPLWLITWVALSNALSSEMIGMSFCSPDHSNPTSRNNDGFVDDTTGGVNDTHSSTPLSPIDLATLLHKQAQLWERLLNASGGRLELPKCFYYLIVWKWTDGDAAMMSIEELNASISLTCGANPNPVPIDQKDVHTSHKTLGTQMNPTGTMTAETHRLKANASKIAAAIERFEGPAWKAKLLWTTRYLPSLGYSLPITTLSPTQVHSIQNRPTRAILGSLGVNRMFPRDVAHGPPTHGGLGLPHLLTIQGTSQLKLLTGHIRQNDVDGKLTLACLDNAQLIAGTSAPLLEFPSLSYPHLKDPWLESHRSFLSDCDAKLIISPAWTPTLHRTHDRLIMEAAAASTTPIDLRHTNQCRLYLQVQRLSDLCNGAGTELLPNALYPTYHRHHVKSTLTWPRQGKASPRAWTT